MRGGRKKGERGGPASTCVGVSSCLNAFISVSSVSFYEVRQVKVKLHVGKDASGDHNGNRLATRYVCFDSDVDLGWQPHLFSHEQPQLF